MPSNLDLSAFSLILVGILIRFCYFRKLKCHSGQYACKCMCFMPKFAAGEKVFPLFRGIEQMSTWRTAEWLHHCELWHMLLSTLSSSDATILLSPIWIIGITQNSSKHTKRLVKTKNMPQNVKSECQKIMRRMFVWKKDLLCSSLQLLGLHKCS